MDHISIQEGDCCGAVAHFITEEAQKENYVVTTFRKTKPKRMSVKVFQAVNRYLDDKQLMSLAIIISRGIIKDLTQ